jgi:hypothetical protein
MARRRTRLLVMLGAALLAVLGTSSRALAQDEPIPQPEGDFDVTTFDETLSPYGQWVDTGEGPSDGRAWRPDPDVVGEDFQPYATGGRWVYSDWGWTWESDYPWGWAPFHYGRWALTPPGLGLVSRDRLGSRMGRLALRGWLHRLGSAAPRGVCGRRPALAALLVLRPEQRLHLSRRLGVPAPGGPHPRRVRGHGASASGGELRAGTLVRRPSGAPGGARRGPSRSAGHRLHPSRAWPGAAGPSLHAWRGRPRRPGAAARPAFPRSELAPAAPCADRPAVVAGTGPLVGRERLARACLARPESMARRHALAGRRHLGAPPAPRRAPRPRDRARARWGTGVRSPARSRPPSRARAPRPPGRRPSARAASGRPPAASALPRAASPRLHRVASAELRGASPPRRAAPEQGRAASPRLRRAASGEPAWVLRSVVGRLLRFARGGAARGRGLVLARAAVAVGTRRRRTSLGVRWMSPRGAAREHGQGR